jgi:hypothetical protein
MTILWTSANQTAIRPISDNNLTRKFNRLAELTQIKDLKPLLGYDMFQDLIQNPSATANAKLLAGGTFTYNGITYTFDGLKYVLANFFFANYIVDNLEDTFSGFVTKSNEDSQPASSGDKKNIRDLAVEAAMQYWEDCKKYIESDTSLFPYYNSRPTNNRLITI